MFTFTRIFNPRPRAYAKDLVWRVEQIPVDAETRDTAVFVVHGMGALKRETTAVGLRYGFEDAADRLSKENPPIDIPPLYLKEGYWGDYPDIAETLPKVYASFNPGEKSFFAALWKARTRSAVRTAAWFMWQAARLPFYVFRGGRGADGAYGFWHRLVRLPMYVLILFLAVISVGVLLLLPFGRQILARVLGDVRFYLAPEGDIERAIVQGIDRRVGHLFLELLGLDWNFQELAVKDQLRVGGVLHKFDKVVWAAHSLGTIVSYNVVSDLLHRCQELQAKAMESQPPNAALLGNIERVKRGLHRFVTFGSPLQKIADLFPNALRPWPAEYLAGFLAQKENPATWWVNFYDIFDPVSGKPRHPRFFRAVYNQHTTNRRPWLGYAHVLYWTTPGVTQYILRQATHDPQTTFDGYPNGFFSHLWRHLVMLGGLFIAFLLELRLVWVVAPWLWIALKWLYRRALRPGLRATKRVFDRAFAALAHCSRQVFCRSGR